VTTWLRAYGPKIISGLAIAAVAGVAGVVSYLHIYGLTLTLHQPVIVARLMPFAVDGLIVVGSVVLLTEAAAWWLGWLGVGPGVTISLFANVESGIRYGVLAAIWAGIRAVAFSLATFMLERWLKAQASPEIGSAAADLEPVPGAYLNGSGLHPAEVQPFVGELARGEVPTIRRIRDELHVGQPKAQEIRARLSVLAHTP
jgi:Protein of unknown function (DUF2637)